MAVGCERRAFFLRRNFLAVKHESWAFTLLEVMTLESWSEGVARPLMELFPHAWLFFVLFILIATFVIINLFIAVIVDSISTIKPVDHTEDPVTAEIRMLREELAELRETLVRKH